MKSLATVLMVVLMTLTFSASLSATAPCEGGHEAECTAECECVCCSAPAFTSLDHGSRLNTNKPERALPPDMHRLDRLSSADIFRPPISA